MATSVYNWFNDFKQLIKESEDDRTKNLPFMDSPLPIILLSISYLYFVCKAGPKFMLHKKPFNLNTPITIYNTFQILACIYIMYGMLSTHTFNRFGCEKVDYTHQSNSITLAKFTWLAALLKVTEYIETVFFVLRKKQNQVSGLHLYHHISTLTFGWLTTKFSPGEPTVFPISLNCFIHVLMYGYYLAALHGGKELQKKLFYLKRSLTILQMVQFTFIIAHLLSSFRSDCAMPKLLNITLLLNMFINYFLFYKFYVKTYKKKE